MWPLIVAPVIALIFAIPAYVQFEKELYLANNKVSTPSISVSVLLILSLFFINVQVSAILFNNFTPWPIGDSTEYNPFKLSIYSNVILNAIFAETLLLIVLFIIVPLVSVKRFEYKSLLKNIEMAKCSNTIKIKDSDFLSIKHLICEKIKLKKIKPLESNNIFYIHINGLHLKVKSTYGSDFKKLSRSRHALVDNDNSVFKHCINFLLFNRFKDYCYVPHDFDTECIESIDIVFKSGELSVDHFYVLGKLSIFEPVTDDDRLLLEMMI